MTCWATDSGWSCSRSARSPKGSGATEMAPGASQPDSDLERRASSRLLDVLIRAGLIAVLAVLCYLVFAPFLALMAWAGILAVTLSPLHRSLASRVGGKQGLAATILVLGGLVLIVMPTALLMDSLGSSVHDLVRAVQHNTLAIHAPREGV